MLQKRANTKPTPNSDANQEEEYSVSKFVWQATPYEIGKESSNLGRWTTLWIYLISAAQEGYYDEDTFIDAADFSFEDYVKEAKEGVLTRGSAYQALFIRMYAALDVSISPEFKASQLVAEALCAQVCAGWNKIDGEILDDKLEVCDLDGNYWVIDMCPAGMTPIVEHLRSK